MAETATMEGPPRRSWWRRRPAHGRRGWPSTLARAYIAYAEILVIAGWITGELDAIEALAAHATAGLALPLAALAERRMPDARDALDAGLLLTLGPLGGLLVAVSGLSGALARAYPALARDVGARTLNMDALPSLMPARAEAVLADMQSGRRPDGPPGARSFTEELQGDDLGAQQRVMGFLSRRWSPEMMPALKLALASDVPALRVQAAAVYAGHRGKFAERLKTLLQRACDANDASDIPALRDEAREVVQSGFVDAESARALCGAVEEAAARVRPVARYRSTEPRSPALAGMVAAADGRPPALPASGPGTGLAARPPSLRPFGGSEPRRYSCGGMA